MEPLEQRTTSDMRTLLFQDQQLVSDTTYTITLNQYFRHELRLLMLNRLFIALGVFANLAFEVIELDLYIVALLALLAVGLLWRSGKQSLLIYYGTAYVLGLVATGLYKAITG